MDNSKSQIPVNTRTVGNPEKTPSPKYILYIEDYVHTFMQKSLENDKKTLKMPLFGKCIDKDDTINFVISGAAMENTDSAYFPNCTYLGTATVEKSDKKSLRFEIISGGIISIIEDYYIYYDQNEEMQNYLIKWTTTKPKEAPAPKTDTARYTRILQAYNREEAKLSFMWNAMHLLGLGFAVFFMAYAIIAINNYNKMQSMQSGIDYCIKMLDMQLAVNEAQEDEKEPDNETIKTINDTTDETETETETETKAAETINNDIPQYYIVQPGDTLRTISMEIYGDYEYIEKICLWNGIEDADNILCGQKLLLHQK